MRRQPLPLPLMSPVVLAILQQWVDTKWDAHQSSCEADKELTRKILNQASLTFDEVNGVGVLVEYLEVQMKSFTYDHNSKFAMESLDNVLDLRHLDLRKAALTLFEVVDRVYIKTADKNVIYI